MGQRLADGWERTRPREWPPRASRHARKRRREYALRAPFGGGPRLPARGRAAHGWNLYESFRGRRRRSERSNDLAEYAPPGTKFHFSVRFQNLSGSELDDLVHCVCLEKGLGHKFGMAKPLGFGSCAVRLREAECAVRRGGDRYRQWQGAPAARAFPELDHGPFPASLRDILRLDKQARESVGYLDWGRYRGARIDDHGRYVFKRAQPAAAERMSGVVASALKKAGAKKSEERSAIRKGEKIKVQVTAQEGPVCVLRVKKTGQEGLRYRPRARWQVGQTVKLTVVKVDDEGRVTEVKI